MVDNETKVEETQVVVEPHQVRFGEKVQYLEGAMTHELVLSQGDRLQIWFNDRKRDGKQDPDVCIMVLPKGKQKGVDTSNPVTGAWVRLKYESQGQ